MPYKDPQKRRQMVENRRNKGYAVIQAAKNKPCDRCGDKFPSVCMDFHHRDPKTKLFKVGGKGTATRSIQSILEEIDKCDLLCANCHRIEHYGLVV